MSATRTHAPESSGPLAHRRVRDQAREALALMAFSAAVSVACVLLLLIPHLFAGPAGR
ncbi:MAG TPA: hypothetical protein VNT31_06080 [Nocardioides sp.]|nr:hypothetical protein [Nocardioides sp.]